MSGWVQNRSVSCAAKHSRTPWSQTLVVRTVFLVALIAFGIAASRRDLWSPDEQRHAEVGRSMLVTGEYALPHLERAIYPDKPPPPFWMIAGSMRVFGIDAFAARAPFFVAAAATIALTARIALMLSLGATSGLLAALCLATSFRYAWLAQRVSLDILMTLFSTVAVWAWLRQWQGIGSSVRNGLLFFGAAAIGVSIKGPLGVLVPLLTAVVHGLWTGRMARFLRRDFLLPALVFPVVIATWLVPACLSGGEAYTRELLFKQSAGRVFHAWNHEHPFWYYLGKLPVEFLPWTPALLLGLWLVVRRRLPGDRDNTRFLMAWFLPAFVFLSIVQSKRGNYLVPIYPALAIFTAMVVERLAATKALRRVALGTATLLGVVALATLAAPLIPKVRALPIGDPWPGAIAVGTALLAGAAVALYRLRNGQTPAAMIALAAGMLATLSATGALMLPAIDPVKSPKALALALKQAAGRPDLMVPFYEVHTEEYCFYSGLDCREFDRDEFFAAVADPATELAVVEERRWNKAQGRLGSVSASVIHEGRVSDEQVLILRIERPASDEAGARSE